MRWFSPLYCLLPARPNRLIVTLLRGGAANGDKLQVQIDGILDPVAAVDQGVFHFVGGTGRFEGASGDANFLVSINPVTGGFDLTVVGKINF